ncbi:SPFH domain-containing protein [Streptomyces sp. NPDC015661]|uniref:SPFH domain-containing protein n=1 Tax=Streptomyces sp. NPDC015661 TaxID=3364961 RepID=UPI0036FC260F
MSGVAGPASGGPASGAAPGVRAGSVSGAPAAAPAVPGSASAGPASGAASGVRVGSVSGAPAAAPAVPGSASAGPASGTAPGVRAGSVSGAPAAAPAAPGSGVAGPASGGPASSTEPVARAGVAAGAPGAAPAASTCRTAGPGAAPLAPAGPLSPSRAVPVAPAGAASDGSSAPAPVRPAPGAAPAPSAGAGSGAAPGGSDTRTAPAVSGASPEAPAPGALDFGRIRGARVGSVAVPVAGVVRVARRKNVIGSETTGSIPVHLLFRDEPGSPVAEGDDGGPDTIAMAAPTPPTASARRAAIPAPSKVQAPVEPDPRSVTTPKSKAQSKGQATAQPRNTSRPAPTADPALVERSGPVLPGWVGVVGGALAVAGCAAIVWWAGAVPAEAARMLRLPARPYHGIHLGQWALLALGVVLALFSLGGLGRGRVGYAWVLTLFGDYRGTVRRTGLLWVSPLLLRRRVDVRLRHWRSEPLPAVDAKGTALDVTVLVVWRVRDTVRASLGVDGHEDYLREQVEAAMARVLSQLPADAFHEDAPTLRDAEAVGAALTRMLSAECAPVGVDVFSAQPTRIEYAPEVAAAMRRRRIAAIDAKHRDSVLTSVVDAVDDVVHRLTSRGLVELDDYERKALVKDLTVAFYTGRTGPVEGA